MAQEKHQSRRDFIKKSAYAAPIVLSFNAMPAMATSGSVTDDCISNDCYDGPEGGKYQQDGPSIDDFQT